MSETPNLELPYILAAQAQKHVTHNEAIRRLDALVQLAVSSRSEGTVPETPADGARYIVPDPAGDWPFAAGTIAAWQDGGWTELMPREGWIVHVADEQALLVFGTADWQPVSGSGSQTTPLLGVNAQADTTTRLAVSSANVRLDHEGGDQRLILNKATINDVGSIIFQAGFEGRAEFGLVGSDNLTLRVSADGTTWTDALVVDQSSGAVSLPQTSSGSSGEPATLPTPGCRLIMTNTSLLTLTTPLGPTVVLHNSAVSLDPSNPPTLSSSGLAASTLYYVYLKQTGGTFTLEASIDASTNDPRNGLPMRSGDFGQLLVGMVRTGSSGEFTDQPDKRWVASRWARRNRIVEDDLSQSFVTSSTSTYQKVVPSMQLDFLSWGDDAVSALAKMRVYNGVNRGAIYSAMLDSANTVLSSAYVVPVSPNVGISVCFGQPILSPEGENSIIVAVKVASGTGGVAASPGDARAQISASVLI
jgi:hypothetical protein